MIIENLELRTPGPGEVLLRIEALGLNRAEALFEWEADRREDA